MVPHVLPKIARIAAGLSLICGAMYIAKENLAMVREVRAERPKLQERSDQLHFLNERAGLSYNPHTQLYH